MSSKKVEKIQSALVSWKVDGIIITNVINCRWVSGFTGSNCTLVITANEALLGTDFRYWEQAANQAPDFELIKMGKTDDLAKTIDLVEAAKVKRLGFEANHMTVSTYSSLKRQSDDVGYTKLIPLNSKLEQMRYVKSADELEKIKASARITDLVMGRVNDIVKPGMTEKAVAWELEKQIRENGADGTAFNIIVAAGLNGSMAHHRPSDYQLKEGDTIIVDMGALLDGWHSDLTRTFFLGNAPDDKFSAVYDLVHMAQKNALKHIKAGMLGTEIDYLAREVIEDAGHGEKFGHSLGHGVGLNIHEGPSFSTSFNKEIPAGAVMSVEPGVYLPDWGGVRIEDLVVVTEDGFEYLSHCPKNPIINI
ncbi:MAG: aminopeptidase P family protein [Chloroflexota bacterium]